MTDGNTCTVERFTAADRVGWEELFAGYLTFYRTKLDPRISDQTWRRIVGNDMIFAFGVWTPERKLVAFVHYLMHPTTWIAGNVCYLEDLYVAPPERRHGLARKLIAAVAADARIRSAEKLYWQTHETNAAGRRLYDSVARFNGFIRYDFPLTDDG